MSKKFKLKRKDHELGIEIEMNNEGISISDEFAEHLFYFTNKEFEQIVKDYIDYRKKENNNFELF